MGPVEARRDEDALAQPAEADPRIDMRQTLHEAKRQDDQRKLQRRQPDQQADSAKPGECDQIIQQVIAGIAPEGHLTLRMMQ